MACELSPYGVEDASASTFCTLYSITTAARHSLCHPAWCTIWWVRAVCHLHGYFLERTRHNHLCGHFSKPTRPDHMRGHSSQPTRQNHLCRPLPGHFPEPNLPNHMHGHFLETNSESLYGAPDLVLRSPRISCQRSRLACTGSYVPLLP